MITHFEATMTLLATILGMLTALATGIWKARGWIDRLNATDSRLASAITSLDENQRMLHQANQERFRAIEAQLAPRLRGREDGRPGRRGR